MRTVFTAIFGNSDELKRPFNVSQHWNFVCYTDQDFESDVWEIRKVPVMPFGPAKTARWYKINFFKHLETEDSLWVDATFFVNCDLNRWWKRFQQPMTVINHPFDDCIYTDVKSCIGLGKGDFWKLTEQAHDYRNIGIPLNNGLIASGILMRRNTPEVRELCETWWSQVEKYTERDQIAFGYAAWKHPGVVNYIDWDYTQRTEFIHIPHLSKPWRNEKFNKIMKQYGSKTG